LTQDHASWAQCAKAANIRVGATLNSPQKAMFDQTKRELGAYQELRRHGIQPEGTTMDKISAARSATEVLGRPYNAEKDPPAKFIQTKAAATFVKAGE
jgi:hypothetical protein